MICVCVSAKIILGLIQCLQVSRRFLDDEGER
jgi:hypothetical protein